ncbi:hypothetical protein [Paenibacillus glycanilyticus]|uniref:Uncharacterized protein n=1 Tax=Paenibacillus glycanilyticus TaxID=126569 RepID=A0ABQ6GB26_9BACL|nr:hypothetical protein [Paenibacillus glycanilyticus]GLX68164.1 hypothetical protein MU1_25090 [Paenibacillus glycanilyticus]
MRKWIRNAAMAAIIASSFLVAVPTLQAVPAPSSPVIQDNELQSTVRGWMNELAKLPEFKAWNTAEFTVAPLGPGTHSWIAIVKQQEQSIGYLVIHAKENGGLVLGEYGTGEYLFDQTTLHQSLAQLELPSSSDSNKALYIHPLLAVWDIHSAAEDTFLDGMSGEWLPVQQDLWDNLAADEKELATKYALSGGEAMIDRAVKSRSFDPYSKMPWLTDKPIAADAENIGIVLKALSSKEPLRYTAERFNKEMLYVWSVTGYHRWGTDGTVFAALETDELGTSTRYIPLKLLAELGSFYR